METSMADPKSLSRLELISLYINHYYDLDPAQRSSFATEVLRRKLPLPDMPASRPTARPSPGMDRYCFLDYVLLIYSGTAIVYSWIFLIERLVKLDIAKGGKHRVIQAGIALFYVIAEILLFVYFSTRH